MPLAKYASDDRARLLVTQAVEQIEGFLDNDATADAPVRVTDAAVDAPVGVRELAAAERSLLQGRVWDGLASLRRAIEAELRDLAKRQGIAVGRKGAGQILAELERREALPPDLAERLRYAITVANKGVHGEPVDPSQADEVFSSTRQALDALRDVAS